jgi:uncharacterized protein (TIGR02246 family)
MSPADFMRLYEVAANAHDLEAMLNLIADDALFLFSDGTAHFGKGAIRKAIQANFDTIEDEIYRVSDVKWLGQSETIAVCVYAFEWSGIILGKAAGGAGRGTTVLRCQDGDWRVVHEHLSRGGLQ